MNTNDLRIANFQTRVTALCQSYGQLHPTSLTVDNLSTSVRVALHGALVEAEEVWGGIEQAPMDYRAALDDLRDLRSDLAALKAEVDAISN